MKRCTQPGLFLAMLLLACSISNPIAAQRGEHKPPASPPTGNNKPSKNEGTGNLKPGTNPINSGNSTNKDAGGNQMAGMPPKWIEKLQGMPPDQQERFMQNNAAFRKMTPERQAQIRANLQNWNRLTPEQQNVVRQRQAVLAQMTPEQRQYVQQDLLPRWRNLPPQRQQAIRQHLQLIKDLSDSDRESKLNDPEFVKGLTPEEQGMLRDLSHFQVGPAFTPKQEPPDLPPN
jgi:hypothetical protein